MNEQDRFAIGTSYLLEVNLMQSTIKLAATEGRLYRKQLFFLNERIRHSVSISHKFAGWAYQQAQDRIATGNMRNAAPPNH